MLIVLENLFFRYETEPADSFALKDVSFALEPGECVALIGPSGSGKSTLAQILNGLFQPARGRLLIDGLPQEYKPKLLRDLRRRVGLVFQLPEAQIFEATVFDEVAFAARQWGIPAEEICGRVEAALEMVGLEPTAFVSRNPMKLSGGEARLITIASFLVTDPDWLLLDEPTLGLDFPHTRKIARLVQSRKESKRGVLLITHNLDLASSLCPSTIVLSKGQIVFAGSTQELLLSHDLRREFGLIESEAIRIWKMLRSEWPDLRCSAPNCLESALMDLSPEKRQRFIHLVQQEAGLPQFAREG